MALDELLTRWNLHMGVSAAERRMALRMSRQDEALSNQIETHRRCCGRRPAGRAGCHRTGGSTASFDREETAAGDDDTDDELAEDYDDDSMDWA